MKRSVYTLCSRMLLISLFTVPQVSQSEVILQYFNTSYTELINKIPELAEAGYGALWLPPPTKASGGLSVGYDLWDPFDLGGKDQRSTVKTRYGTEEELLRMIRTAHRFGLRVYFDNIMNHRAFDIPGYNETTPIDIYPGMLPEDFHLRVTEDGFYRKWDNTRSWDDVWQVQHLGLADLIDIAHETPNQNFGTFEGATHPKISFVRDPTRPDYYAYGPTNEYLGFGNVTQQMLDDHPDYYTEDVGAYLMRAVRWLMDTTKADGLRLDAVKHVPSYFFGQQSGAGKDGSNDGYTGKIQEQFNLTRGYSDWGNHRDTVFNTERPRDDAMMFGEHLGQPPGFQEFIDAGMRLLDAPLHSHNNSILGQPWSTLEGMDQPGYSSNPSFNDSTGVMFAQSHDDDYYSRRELQHAYYLTRRGLPNIYTDGNHQSETLQGSGGAFPRHANNPFLGQFGDLRTPNLVYIHNHFARGDQVPKWGDNNVLAYERRDKRDEGWGDVAMSDADGTVLLFMMNDDYSSGQARGIASTFGHTPFVDDAYLYNYSSYGGGFYTWASQINNGNVIIPPGGYFAFSWRSPEASDLWREAGGHALTLYQNGSEVTGRVAMIRRDGPNGDIAFNPHNLPNRGFSTNETPVPYAYKMEVPRITSATNIGFVARVDGSAKNVLFKLDGGVDLNAQMWTNKNEVTGSRDRPPALYHDTFLGWEDAAFVKRIGPEKFGAVDSVRNKIGSLGAETYVFTVGQAGFTINQASATNNWDGTDTAVFVYHDPATTTDYGQAQIWPAPENAADANLWFWVKTGNQFDINKVYVYYTTDGKSWPEGAGGAGVGNTKVVELMWKTNIVEGADINDWWGENFIPAQPDGTVVRYKVSAVRQQDGGGSAPWEVVFPAGPDQVARKKTMMGVWEINSFNASTVPYFPHNDWAMSSVQTGLVDGFHFIEARAFLDRDGRAAIFNTFPQTFYLDAHTPDGEVKFPAENDTLPSQEYGVVVRTDPTVTEVWYNIVDSDAANDDGATGQNFGNGTNLVGESSWALATQLTPSLNIESAYPREWRFTYRNIPSSGTALIRVMLREASSSTNLNLTAEEGHYTILERNVNTSAPNLPFFFDWPGEDGFVVQEGWIIRIHFAKSLGDGIDDETLRNRFLVRINGSAQSKSTYQITRDIGGDLGRLEFALPALYNGDANFLHNILVTHTTAGDVVLETSRFVKAAPADTGPYVVIVSPTEIGSDGQPTVITLRDVAVPDPEDRAYKILVETDADAKDVWIEFYDNAGGAGKMDSSEVALAGLMNLATGTNWMTGVDAPLSGTVSVTTNLPAIAGSGTLFLSEVHEQNRLRIDTHDLVVTQVFSDISLAVNKPYPGATGTGLNAYVQPILNTELHTGSQVKVGTNLLTVSQALSPTSVVFNTVYTGATLSNGKAYRVTANPADSGNRLVWSFQWTNMTAGFFTFYARVDTDGNTNTVEASATRNIRVILREFVDPDDGRDDDDDDGLGDMDEVTRAPLPEGNSEAWVNGDVHWHNLTGRTDPLRPDTDGDGLPDALEVGLSSIVASDTVPGTDTNGDGWPNFMPDRDPPIYNTTDNSAHPKYNFNRGRGDQLSGSMTDPAREDTDYDGLIDRLEDLNRNGRVDVGLVNASGVVTNVLRGWDKNNPGSLYLPTVYNSSMVDRNALPVHAFFLETDPNNGDTDGDGLSDGNEDSNQNGLLDMRLLWPAGTSTVFNITDYPQYLLGMDASSVSALNGVGETSIVSRAINYTRLFEDYGRPVYDTNAVAWVEATTNVWPRVLFLETDPLNRDTNGDALPDGWKVRYGLNPWDDGWYNLNTGVMNLTNSQQGADGDLTGDGISNWQHYLNGTDPRVPVNYVPPVGSIVVGPGLPIGEVDGVMRYEEFMDWTWADLLALDAYQGGGNNNQGGDIYRAWDGWDTSRDLVAFYARDGGSVGLGGDDRFYFRFDFHDLQALAEQGQLDLYVVINFGNMQGERVLPDEVDALTDMRWKVVAAVYESSFGTVYVDEDSNNNTSTFGQDLFANGVVSHGEYFLGAYFNAELDAMEFAIDRQALLDAGWNGADPADLNYQVYSTKSGTENSPQGPGDIGGRNDLRDSIMNDWLAEDHWFSQPGLQGTGSVLTQWIQGNSQPGRVKVAQVIHGNQSIQPGSATQALINNNAGTGYYRPIDAHEVFRAPLNLHITPTLASSIQWASVDPAANQPWRDGPAFNERLRTLMATNVVRLLGSTFSDHMLPYFTPAYNVDNAALATEFLETIYDVAIGSNTVFWTPERLLDGDTFQKIDAMGFKYTLLDQMVHLWQWLGRTTALSDDGYRINRFFGVNTFAINDQANSFRFDVNDSGLSMPLRRLLNLKARSGTQDQVVLFMSNWEDFKDPDNADAYDASIRWLANRPWVALVALEDIANGLVDLTGDGSGDTWWVLDRGSDPRPKISHDYVQYATRENYDHWYVGEPGYRESLEDKVFEVRAGVNVPDNYGMLYSGGVVSNTWNEVLSINDAAIARLARGVAHASVFQTAFHDQPEIDLRKFSTGDYINPDETYRTLAEFAKIAQSQTRMAAIYAQVDQWAASAASVTNTQGTAVDVDLDGENEYLLYNDRILALFERVGGRMIGAWVRKPSDGSVYQTVGNFLSYAGEETELEGWYNANTNGIGAYRTSGLKDWWAGTGVFVNDLYTFTNWTNGWRIVSSDGKITKTVTLPNAGNELNVQYTVDPGLNGGTLYVRHGLSPDLFGLLLNGQQYLEVEDAGGVLRASHTRDGRVISARIAYGTGGYNATYNGLARDDNQGEGITFSTVNMRNQAQTQQVELMGTGTFSFGMGFDVLDETDPDTDGDGIPDWWESTYYGGPTNANATAMASNQVNTILEAYIANLNPTNPTSFFQVNELERASNGMWIRFQTESNRNYYIWYANHSLMTPTWDPIGLPPIAGDGEVYQWLDDGTLTTPAPGALTNRFYRIDVRLPD